MPISVDRKYVMLLVLTAINVVAFWHRNLLFNLTAVSLKACSSQCEKAPFAPLCLPCSSVADEGSNLWEACEECQSCRSDHHSNNLIIQDGACFTNSQFSVLAGVSFTLVFAVAGLFVGAAVDQFGNRRILLAVACVLWSLATGAVALCSNFKGLLVARLLLALFQALNSPCAYPLIGEAFKPDSRSTANGLYGVGTYLGRAVSSLTIGVALRLGWRATTYVSAGSGMLAAALLYWITPSPSNGDGARRCGSGSDLVKLLAGVEEAEEGEEERALLVDPRSRQYQGSDSLLKSSRSLPPPQGGDEFSDSPPPSSSHPSTTTPPEPPAPPSFSVVQVTLGLIDVARVVASSQPLLLLFGGTSLRMCVTYAAEAYLPVYFARAFPTHDDHFGLSHAVAILAGGAVSAFVGGRVADKLGGKYPSLLAWVPSLGGALAVPPLVLALGASQRFSSAMVLLGVQYLLAECWLGPGMTLLQALLRDHYGTGMDHNSVMSTAVGLILFVNTLAASAAPALIGAYDDGTAAGLRASLLAVLCLSYLGSSVLFALLGRHLGGSPPASSSALAYCLKKEEGPPPPVVFLDSLSAAGESTRLTVGEFRQQQHQQQQQEHKQPSLRDVGPAGAGGESGAPSAKSPRKATAR